MSSAPKVLLCELRLSPGESKTYTYRESLPPDAPPSHHGKNVRIHYHVMVGVQALNSAVNVVKIPFRVLNACSAAAAANGRSVPAAPASPPPQEQLAIANPFAGGLGGHGGSSGDLSDSSSSR